MFEEFDCADDTNPAFDERWYQKLSQMTPTQRMKLFFEFNAATRAFVRAGILTRYPEASDAELKMRYSAIMLGREFALKHYGWNADIEGY